MRPRIVITGAPASGKTVIFERLKTHSFLSDFLFFHELARALLMENPEYRDDWAEFHREIYRQQVARELGAGDRPFITDRGTLDAFAFHPEGLEEVGTAPETEYARYSAVMHLGSAASLGAEYYQQDRVRHESVEKALRIERALRRVWGSHAGYVFVPAHPDFERKYQACVDLLLTLLNRVP